MMVGRQKIKSVITVTNSWHIFLQSIHMYISEKCTKVDEKETDIQRREK